MGEDGRGWYVQGVDQKLLDESYDAEKWWKGLNVTERICVYHDCKSKPYLRKKKRVSKVKKSKKEEPIKMFKEWNDMADKKIAENKKVKK